MGLQKRVREQTGFGTESTDGDIYSVRKSQPMIRKQRGTTSMRNTVKKTTK